MKVIYRISDGGYTKNKPNFVTKKGCFLHFLNIFKNNDIYVIADNVHDETYQFLISHISHIKVIRTHLNNAAAFMFSVQFAIDHFKEDDQIYFAEDDYIYTRNAPEILKEGLTIAHYTSGYDHPDKYMNHNEGGPNPFISEGGESTRVLITKSTHWKLTNSCCMTFATTIKIVKEDLEIYKKHCSTSHPYDFQMFCELITDRNRKLISAIPAVSTHGEIEWLAKFIDWENEFYSST